MSTRPSLPIVAVVGRPNVGKSSLFNRLVNRHIAIVEDQPGVTRDRLYSTARWRGRAFSVVDTGGMVSGASAGLASQVRSQVSAAIAEADLVLLVVDARDGLLPEDLEMADLVRRSRIPVIVVANKADSPLREAQAAEFSALGLGDPLAVSAYHGLGTGDLLDAVVALLPEGGVEEEQGEEAAIAVAVVGRPNVGKSSLINAMLGEERVVVDEEPGTTRDAVDTLCERAGRRYTLIDTAGLRRRARVARGVESYSVSRTRRAIERADVAVLVLDATGGVADQDQRIAADVARAGCGVVVVLNKWDLVAATPSLDRDRERSVRGPLRFLGYAPITAASAVKGWGIAGLFEAIDRVGAAHRSRIPTGPLNRVVESAVAAHQPPADAAGRRLKVFYATQPKTRPPMVVLFVNEPSRMAESYLRYLEGAIRSEFDLEGTPLRLALRRRRQDGERRAKGGAGP